MFLNKKIKKNISLFLIIGLLIPTLFFSKTSKLEATGMTVFDFGNLVANMLDYVENAVASVESEMQTESLSSLELKEYVWDPLLYSVASLVKNEIISSTLDWINSGFDGNPAFITDPGGFFLDIADGVLGEWIYGSSLKFLCSPFSLNVKLALIQQFTTKKYEPKCRISEVFDRINNTTLDASLSWNIDSMTDNLSQEWNWEVWDSLTQDSGNNPYGAFIDSSQQINDDILWKQNLNNLELTWGNGFFSYKKCEPLPEGEMGPPHCETVTPGGLIGDMTVNVANMGNLALISADEIDEIVGALLGQLAKKVLGPEGLISVSQSDSDGYSYADLLRQDVPDLSNIKSEITKTTDQKIQTEEDYIKPKQDSLNAVTVAKNKLLDLKECYLTKYELASLNPPSYLIWNSYGDSLSTTTISLRIESVNTTINQKISPVENRLVSDINEAEFNINTLNDITYKISTVTTAQQVDSLVSELQSLILHSTRDIVDARIERDGGVNPGIIQIMADINIDTQKEIIECQGYTFTSDPT
ncbi:hypothetical protein L6261_04330 [Candidatus Parcubacteria bacterium]|nr:hypothetical protein [Candidatus Parcubacteria bacterium]